MSPVDQFAALADPTRLRVIELLSEKPRPVHELAAAFAISRPAISRHLKVLKDAALVKEEKHGRENVYALQRQKLKPAADWLDKHRMKVPKPPKAIVAKPGPKAAAPKPAARIAPQLSFDL